MLGLSLEGGGAKGAFHMGAIQAFLEAGYEIGGITGTSIGALNGAVIAQGDFEAGFQWWNSVNNASLFDLDQPQVQKLLNKKIDKDSLRYFSAKLKDIIGNKGLDTKNMRRMLHGIIDEEKLRNSPIDFGIVTVSLSELKPLELYKEDIPKGQMLDFLMASANLPVFKLEPIDGKYYIDGGFYDNCPINLLNRKGYDHIIAIRTMGIGITRKPRNPNMQVTYLIPSENLGHTFNFDQKSIQHDLQLGYHDAQKLLKNHPFT